MTKLYDLIFWAQIDITQIMRQSASRPFRIKRNNEFTKWELSLKLTTHIPARGALEWPILAFGNRRSFTRYTFYNVTRPRELKWAISSNWAGSQRGGNSARVVISHLAGSSFT